MQTIVMETFHRNVGRPNIHSLQEWKYLTITAIYNNNASECLQQEKMLNADIASYRETSAS